MSTIEKSVEQKAAKWAIENNWMNYANCYREEAFLAGYKAAEAESEKKKKQLEIAKEHFFKISDHCEGFANNIASEALKQIESAEGERCN